MNRSPHRGTRARRQAGTVVRRLVASVGAVSLAAMGFVVVNIAMIWTDSPVSHWRSAQAQEEFDRLYDQAMTLLPRPGSVHDIPTSYGTVRAYTFEHRDADEEYRARTPALLVPGIMASAPTWYHSVEQLSGDRPVIIVDPLGQPGRSVQRSQVSTDADQAAWLEETLSGLGLEAVHLVGNSFGGYLAMNYARHEPARVASISVVEPVYVVAPVKPAFIVGGVLASFPLLPNSFGDIYSRWIAGGSEASAASPVAALLEHGRRHFAAVTPVPRQLEAADLADIDVPVLIALAGRSVAHDTETAVAGTAALEDLTLIVDPDASHAMHAHDAENIDSRIIDFTRTVDRCRAD